MVPILYIYIYIYIIKKKISTEIYWSNLLVLSFVFIFTLLKSKSGQNIIMTHGPNTIYIYIYIYKSNTSTIFSQQIIGG